MPGQEVVLGIDIGGTNTVAALVDREGNTLFNCELPTSSEQPAAHLFRTIYDAISSELTGVQLRGVGIGAPNANYFLGTIEHPPNLKWDYVDLRQEVQLYTTVPVGVTNDANAAALGELLFGVGRGMKNFVQITLGTGLGSGIILNGELYSGSHGYAGEIGHTIVESGGRLCGCGRRGCLETYVSAPALVANAREQMQHHPESKLYQLDVKTITARDVYTAAQSADAAALAAFEETGSRLGLALSNTVAHFDPEAFVLFGGVALAGEYLLEPVRRHLESNLMTAYRGKVKVLLSALPGAAAAVLGAAALGWQEVDRSGG